MKRAKNHFAFFAILSLSLQNSFAGEPLLTITGKVTTDTGVALAGVRVAPKDKRTTGTTTNENVAFLIDVPGGAIIFTALYGKSCRYIVQS